MRNNRGLIQNSQHPKIVKSSINYLILLRKMVLFFNSDAKHIWLIELNTDLNLKPVMSCVSDFAAKLYRIKKDPIKVFRNREFSDFSTIYSIFITTDTRIQLTILISVKCFMGLVLRNSNNYKSSNRNFHRNKTRN